ncbi:energy-coupling factor ABC transporter ATP-binding protein [Pasteurella sp. PK-2025]|uniref:energy-coupling factor ABC transporter ATP-binding protein n=1 Tax=Pasteurella sp. PK-2025 TaxID=3413133 RepID=UPI003C7636B5
MIRTENLSITRQEKTIVNHFTLSLHQDQRLVLCGPIGCGKTTLLHSLLGFIPFEGHIYLLGDECKTEKQFAQKRGKIGLLFQQPDDQLFGPTVLDDVAFGPLNQGKSKEEAYAIAEEQLAQLGISHLAMRSVNQLSGGEKNFTALAGVLAMQPQVLLLDEPTNSLDPHSVARLTQILLHSQLPMLITSHDMAFTQEIATDIINMPEMSSPFR